MVSTTAIFALSGTDTSHFTSQFTRRYPSAQASTAEPWSLSHSLYRTPNNASSSSDYLQILQLSSHPGSTWLCTAHCTAQDSYSAAANCVSIAQGAPTTEFRKVLRERMAPLWQIVRQGDLHLIGGTSLDVGLFRVQMGELVRDRGGAGVGVERRATIVVVSVLAEEDAEDMDMGEGEEGPEVELLKSFVTDLGIEKEHDGIKVLARALGSTSNTSKELNLWCQILRQLSLSTTPSRPQKAEQ